MLPDEEFALHRALEKRIIAFSIDHFWLIPKPKMSVSWNISNAKLMAAEKLRNIGILHFLKRAGCFLNLYIRSSLRHLLVADRDRIFNSVEAFVSFLLYSACCGNDSHWQRMKTNITG